MTQQLSRDTKHGFAVLQAVVAEASLDDTVTAELRARALAEIDPQSVSVLARVVVDFMCRMALWTGAEWTSRTDSTGELVNLEDHTTAERVFTLRTLAAWSAGDRDTYDALVAATLTGADPHQRAAFFGDLLRFLIDRTAQLGRRADLPYTLTLQLTRSIRKEGLQMENWKS